MTPAQKQQLLIQSCANLQKEANTWQENANDLESQLAVAKTEIAKLEDRLRWSNMHAAHHEHKVRDYEDKLAESNNHLVGLYQYCVDKDSEFSALVVDMWNAQNPEMPIPHRTEHPHMQRPS